jgi:hypothetical protein
MIDSDNGKSYRYDGELSGKRCHRGIMSSKLSPIIGSCKLNLFTKLSMKEVKHICVPLAFTVFIKEKYFCKPKTGGIHTIFANLCASALQSSDS